MIDDYYNYFCSTTFKLQKVYHIIIHMRDY